MAKDRKAYQAAYYKRTKKRCLARQKLYRRRNASRLKARDAAYRKANRIRINSRSRQYKLTNATKVKASNACYRAKYKVVLRAKSVAYYAVNRAAIKERRLALKVEVFSHYGGPKCCKCGEKRLGALTIDHINQNGSEHRRNIKLNDRFYKWLKANGYPSGYRVLCINCNVLAYLAHVEPSLSQHPQAIISRQRRRKAHAKLINMLGGRCVVCNSTNMLVLTVHHIHNDGKAHRDVVSDGKAGYKFYREVLRSSDLSEHLQKLECRCFSCNCEEHYR